MTDELIAHKLVNRQLEHGQILFSLGLILVVEKKN
jgi:hypothetical protein